MEVFMLGKVGKLVEAHKILSSGVGLAVLLFSLGVGLKSCVFDDIYDELYNIKNNDLAHNDLFHQYSDKKDDLVLDILSGSIDKDKIAEKRIEIETWYRKAIEDLDNSLRVYNQKTRKKT
jgi:hypothetical protein